MKMYLLFLVAPICALTMAGCKKEPPTKWDYLNLSIMIRVQDGDGNNLLDERANPVDNILGNKMKIIYDGNTYDLKKSTRAPEPDLPVMEGFRLVGWYAEAMLEFGEFSNDTKEYRSESFTLDWGDNTKSEVQFDLYSTPNGDAQPLSHEAIWVQEGVGKGARSDNSLTLTIVK